MVKTTDLATKKFVKKVVQKTEDGLRREIKGLHDKMRKNHGEVMEKLDTIASSIQKFDQEQTALSYRVSEHTDQLENQEGRIKKIEAKVLPA